MEVVYPRRALVPAFVLGKMLPNLGMKCGEGAVHVYRELIPTEHTTTQSL
jgi:hypothetical protein